MSGSVKILVTILVSDTALSIGLSFYQQLPSQEIINGSKQEKAKPGGYFESLGRDVRCVR